MNLIQLGLDQQSIEEAKNHDEDLHIGRVSAQYKDIYKVIVDEEIFAEVSGKLNYVSVMISDYPAVGDWVLVDRNTNNSGNAIIKHILKRKSIFQRKSAGRSSESQILATNIDIVFICMALNKDFNIRRLERYISVAWDSRATPVVVLTKLDLCEDIDMCLMEVEKIAFGIDIVVTSGLLDDYKEVENYIKPGNTVVFIGASGVGKSTLINKLIGNEELKTSEIGNEDKGRHTTTNRQLIVLKNGGVVIDTPGMRELGINSADFDKSFSDIEEIAEHCKFTDCKHENEPFCAVKEAIKDGVLSVERLNNYKKLKREYLYNSLNTKELEREKTIMMFGGNKGMKDARKKMRRKM